MYPYDEDPGERANPRDYHRRRSADVQAIAAIVRPQADCRMAHPGQRGLRLPDGLISVTSRKYRYGMLTTLGRTT